MAHAPLKKLQFFEPTQLSTGEPMQRSGSMTNYSPGSFDEPEEIRSISDLRKIKSVLCINGMFYIGCEDGYVHLYSNDSIKFSQRAHEISLNFMEKGKDCPYTLTFGFDSHEGPNQYNVKFWEFMPDGAYSQSQLPVPEQIALQVVSFAASPDFKYLAFGGQNSQINIYYGKDLPRNTKDVQKRNPLLFNERSQSPITNLHFLQKAGERCIYLFVTSLNSVGVYLVYERSEEKRILEEGDGCRPFSSALDEEKERLMVGLINLEGVAFYYTEFRGSTWGLEGEKQLIKCFKSQCVVVSSIKKQSQLAIHDLDNRYTGFVNTYTSVEQVIVDEEIIYVLSRNNKQELFFQKLTEKSSKEKLSTLYKKNMYDIAYSVAKKEGFEDSFMADISRRQGDHYYSKRDYDNAINCYKQTVGFVEASYVIIQFLDFTKIEYLTSYLEFLHSKHVAQNEHTALLLNCYVHMKDTNRLEKFLEQSNEDFELFDPKTAINVCCKARCFDLALNLAEKHRMSTEYVKIMIEDEKKYRNALVYMESKMSDATKAKTIKEYGKLLMENCPEDTQSFIFATVDNVDLKVNMNSYMPESDLDEPLRKYSVDSGSDFGFDDEKIPNTLTYRQFLENLMSGFSKHPEVMDAFLTHIIDKTPEVDPFIYHSLIEFYLQRRQLTETTSYMAQNLRRPAPTSSFGQKFIVGSFANLNQKETWSTQYYEERLDRILGNSKDRYDKEHVLMLFQLYNYNRGVVFISDLMNNQQELMYNYLKENNYEQIWDTCERYGDQDDDLWVQALTYFASRDDAKCMEYIKKILNRIESKDFLSPLIVLEILGKNQKITFGVIKNYLKMQLRRHKKDMKEDEETIQENIKHINGMRNEIHELKTQARKFQATKCANCEQKLQLPTVHFMCMHSYHQHCLTDNERECQKCYDEANQARLKKEALSRQSNDHETFYKELQGSNDRFETIATYFGRGLFSKFN